MHTEEPSEHQASDTADQQARNEIVPIGTISSVLAIPGTFTQDYAGWPP